MIERHLMWLMDREKIKLPLENMKDPKVEKAALEGLDDNLKVLVIIYKLNMSNRTASTRKIKELVAGIKMGMSVIGVIGRLYDDYIARSYGGVGDGLAGPIYFVTGSCLDNVRRIYEECVRPKETPDNRVSYVPDMADVIRRYTW